LLHFYTLLFLASVGLQAAIVPLTVGAAPFIARMVENALLEIPTGLIEASRAMGATPMQIVRKVLLPEALPGLVNAATITLITLVGYSAMGGAVGAGGLGQIGYQYATGQHAVPDAGSGAVQYGYADVGWPNLHRR
jgi:D-methionine transport system permease protein